MPVVFSEDEPIIDEERVTTLAQAMQKAHGLLQEEDPDPYGYVQEIEQGLGVGILPTRWKAEPDDSRWVTRMRARARRVAVARLFLHGFNGAQISEKLHVSETTVTSDIANCASEWRKSYVADFEAMAGRDLSRLDMYLQKLSPQIERGDVKAINAAVDIIRERSNILGYRHGVSVDITQYVREVAEANGYDPDKAVEIATRVSLTMRS